MAYCNICGKQIPDGHTYCKDCASASLRQVQQQTQHAQPRQSGQPAPKKKAGIGKIGCGLLVILLACAGIYVVVQWASQSPITSGTDATKVPAATRVPVATRTSPPPTAVPKPVTLSGSGDSIQDFQNPFEVAIAHITGNAASHHFAVTSFGSDGERIDLLVNTTEPYEGIRLIDPRSGQHTTRFEINATGSWTIEVLPLSSARKFSVPGAIEGNGDDVVMLTGSTPDLATVKGNAAGRHFAVMGYGQYSDLLVNTTDPYEGTVRLEADTVVLEVLATGSWSIVVKAK